MPGYHVSPRSGLPLTHLARGACAAFARTAACLAGAAPLAPNPVIAIPPSTPKAPTATAQTTARIAPPLNLTLPAASTPHAAPSSAMLCAYGASRRVGPRSDRRARLGAAAAAPSPLPALGRGRARPAQRARLSAGGRAGRAAGLRRAAQRPDLPLAPLKVSVRELDRRAVRGPLGRARPGVAVRGEGVRAGELARDPLERLQRAARARPRGQVEQPALAELHGQRVGLRLPRLGELHTK